jgi:hypothetical protein
MFHLVKVAAKSQAHILQSGRERNSLTYKYYIEIQTVRIFTWQFSIERVSISATVESTMQGLSTKFD